MWLWLIWNLGMPFLRMMSAWLSRQRAVGNDVVLFLGRKLKAVQCTCSLAGREQSVGCFRATLVVRAPHLLITNACKGWCVLADAPFVALSPVPATHMLRPGCTAVWVTAVSYIHNAERRAPGYRSPIFEDSR
jgi:hypothetical protein